MYQYLCPISCASKHTVAEVSKGVRGWSVEVSTNWTKRPRYLDGDGTVYKVEAKERGEELMVKWDAEIEHMGREQFE